MCTRSQTLGRWMAVPWIAQPKAHRTGKQRATEGKPDLHSKSRQLEEAFKNNSSSYPLPRWLVITPSNSPLRRKIWGWGFLASFLLSPFAPVSRYVLSTDNSNDKKISYFICKTEITFHVILSLPPFPQTRSLRIFSFLQRQ